MPLAALALALGSAVLHAAWNLLLARARDVQAAAAATFLLSLALAAPIAVIWWHAERSVWPYALASSLFEIVYIVALAYERWKLVICHGPTRFPCMANLPFAMSTSV